MGALNVTFMSFIQNIPSIMVFFIHDTITAIYLLHITLCVQLSGLPEGAGGKLFASWTNLIPFSMAAGDRFSAKEGPGCRRTHSPIFGVTFLSSNL